MEVGGSDQWSNILAGVEFIRKKSGKLVYALTWPLIVDAATGKKFGKSESGTIWLDPSKTTVLDFYQFLFNVRDESVKELLLRLTLLPSDEIDTIMQKHAATPGEREAQRTLAREVTALVHGREAVEGAITESALRFKKEWSPAEKKALKVRVTEGTLVVDFLVANGYASSKSAARRLIEGSAVKLNGIVVDDTEKTFGKGDAAEDTMIVLTVGKNQPASVLGFEQL